ncbi:MAG TPA: histidine--tRNA ligase [Thermoplasmata archaeon]|nr:histidine--tRNA ligase [Thermoplasmata archaeon]
MPPGPLRGFRDYLPPDAGARSELRRRMRAAARRAGFQELELPTIETQELYARKSGAGIQEQAWAFVDKGGRPVALTPETTPSVARVFVERAKSEPLPVKWFTVAKIWRYEEPQSGRTREFVQFNLDILGVPGVEAEVDLLLAAALVLDEVGAAGLYTFRINDRAVAEGIGRRFGATDTDRFFHAVDRYRKLSAAEFEDALGESGIPADRARELAGRLADSAGGVGPSAVAGFLAELVGDYPEPGVAAGVERLTTMVRLLQRAGLGDRVVYDPTVVRGIAYYTSTVFEAFGRAGEGRSLFGGGRYDRLIELFDGPLTPAVGLAIGDQTVELLLREADRWPDGEPPLDTFVVAADGADRAEVTALVEELRRAGERADGDLLGRSMSRQLKEAARRRARRALILGLKEAPPGTVVERDLASGAQRPLPRDAAARPA